MTFTYVLSVPLSTRNEIRLLVGDTNTAEQLLQDEEIDTLTLQEAASLSGSVNVYRVASVCCDAIAASASRLVNESIDSVSVSLSQRATAYATRAKSLLIRSRRVGLTPYAGGISVADKEAAESDTDRVQPFFTRESADVPGWPDLSVPTTAAAVWP